MESKTSSVERTSRDCEEAPATPPPPNHINNNKTEDTAIRMKMKKMNGDDDDDDDDDIAEAEQVADFLKSFTPRNVEEQIEIVNWLLQRLMSAVSDNKNSTTSSNIHDDEAPSPSSYPRGGFSDVSKAIDIGIPNLEDCLDTLLETFGRNELPKAKLDPYWLVWISAFKDIMMILLLIAMVVLYAVGDWVAASAILIILLIATNIQAYTEYSSNKAAAELGDLPGYTLIRSKNANKANQGWIELVNTKLVPGMIIQLKTGDIVPADAIILSHKGDCSCTEAMLTGESEPVHKYPFYSNHSSNHKNDDPVTIPSLHERQAMTRLYMGTEFSGDCIAIVVETGEQTQMGEIFRSMAEEERESSPLQKMIDRLIFVLAMLSIAASILNAAVCIPTGRGVDPSVQDPQVLTCVLNSVALTVAAVPENLPVALVIALAAIIKSLASRGVIVKSLPAGEELSRLNYVFSDKTGTLTKNEMTVRAVVVPHLQKKIYVPLSPDFVGPPGADSAAADTQNMSVANSTLTSKQLSNNNSYAITDQIRLLAGHAQDDLRSNPTGEACKKAIPEQYSNNIDFQRVLLETATSATKMARVAVVINGNKYLVKVGSDWVLKDVTYQATLQTDLTTCLPQDQQQQEDSSSSTLENFDYDSAMETIDLWAREGYRVICIVAKPVSTFPDEIVPEEMGDFAGDGFIFLGCIVIQDPPREDMAENIRIIRGASVVVTMITGDNPVTGMSIARQVGLASDYTDDDWKMCLINAFDFFQNMSEEDAKREIYKRLDYSMTHKKGLIIGRVSPLQKRWFVEVAKEMKLVTAMTGDGANDAPALKCANVGIAMGNGSDIAKAAGDMILLNPSFYGIVDAIREGRLGFDNILKFLLFLLGTNISEVIVYLTLTFLDVVIVLDALNLLVLNLLTDGFPAIALSLEKAEGDLMKRAPLRRDTSVLNQFSYMSITLTNTALLIAYFVVIFLGNSWYLGNWKGDDTGEVDDYETNLAKVRMMFILLINISELLLGFSHRCPDQSVLLSIGMFSGKFMNYAAFSSMAIIILMTHLPGVKDVMRTEYLDARAYLLVIGMAIMPFVVHEIGKNIIFKRLNYSVYELYKYEYQSNPKLLEEKEVAASFGDDHINNNKNHNNKNAAAKNNGVNNKNDNGVSSSAV